MSVLRHVPSLLRYRRRKKFSLSSSAPHPPRRYVSGMPYSSGSQGYHHDLYMLDNPTEYRPRLNTPAVQQEDYSPDENWESHQISNPTDPRLFRPFPELPVMEENLTYEKSQEASELFLKVMETQYKPFEDSSEIPTLMDIWREHNDIYDDEMSGGKMLGKAEEPTHEDIANRFFDLTGALHQLEDALPQEHQDIVNLKAAIHDMLDDPVTVSKLESFAPDIGPSKLGDGNPYEHDDIIPWAIQFDEVQEPSISPLEQNIFSELDVVEHEAAFSDDFAPSNLEQIVEAEQADYSPDMVFADDALIQITEAEEPFQQNLCFQEDSGFNEIEQAVDEIQQDPMQPGCEPWQNQYDPFDPYQVFGMQYMPGAMPFGPMGPMPGPMM